MRAVEIRLARDLVCELAGRRGWLVRVNVKPRANAARAHRVQERRLIDDLAARSVDEVSARAHRTKEVCTETVARLRFQSDVDAHDVCGACDIERTVGAFNS